MFEYLPAIERLAKSAQNDFYTFVLKDAGHMDFSDLALLKSESVIIRILTKFDNSGTKLGSINGFRAERIINKYLASFFNKYLKGQLSPLLNGNDNLYPEVKNWK